MLYRCYVAMLTHTSFNLMHLIKFELMLLAKYEEEFSSYTLRCFMEQYMAVPSSVTNKDERLSIQKMQSQFSITSVKVLLVSLLNGELKIKSVLLESFYLNGTSRDSFIHSIPRSDFDGSSSV